MTQSGERTESGDRPPVMRLKSVFVAADKMRLTPPLSSTCKRTRDSLKTLPEGQLTCSG